MKRRSAALAALAAASAVLTACGGEEPAPDAAARLVPADALAYVRADLDDEQLRAHVAKLPAVGRFVDGLAALAGPDAAAWRGDEAALALLESRRPAADTLLLVEVADPARARAAQRSDGGVEAALAGNYMAIGQPRVVARAVALARAGGGGLARTREGDLDAWIPERGVRRVLEAQTGTVGALGAVLDDPRLRFMSATVEAEDEGLRVHVRRARRGAAPRAGFEPELLEHVPADASAAITLDGAHVPVERHGLDGLGAGQAVAWVRRGGEGPVLTLVADVADEAAARDAVGRGLGRLAAALGIGGGVGRAPGVGRIDQLEQREIDGVSAAVLPLGDGLQLAVAVSGARLAVSTDPAALPEALRAADEPLATTERFERVVGGVPETLEALAFADLSQLLTLGEHAGLAEGSAAAATRDDLRAIRAFGAIAEREGSDTTAEMFFEIP